MADYELQNITRQIINNLQSASIFKYKCKSLEMIFQRILELIIEDNKYSDEEMIFNHHLSELNDILTDLNFTNLDPSFFENYPSIDSLISAIDNNVKDIFADVKEIYHMIFNIPPYDDFEDLKEFDNISKNLQPPQIREEIRQKYEKSKSPFITMIENYHKTNITEKNYKILSKTNSDNDTHSNSSVEIFQGETNDKEKVRITVFKDRNKFESMFPILATIDHPSLEKFVGVSIMNSGVEIITKVHGKPLSCHMSNPNISPTILAYKIAQAMSYLHSKKIIHCDLNPSNIFVDQIDSENPAKVTITIANFFNSIKLTENSFIGMPNINPSSPFCAPELTHNYYYDEKVDVFAFSGLLYFFLTKKMPFEGMANDEIRHKILNGERPAIPEELANTQIANLILKCWSQNPKNRCSFDKIIDEMLNSNLQIGDLERKDKILDFYKSQNDIKNVLVSSCLDLFEKIINRSSYVFQFKCTFADIQMKLIEYKAELRKAEIAFIEMDFDEDLDEYVIEEEEEEEEENDLDNIQMSFELKKDILIKLKKSLLFLENILVFVEECKFFKNYYCHYKHCIRPLINSIRKSMHSIWLRTNMLTNAHSLSKYHINNDNLAIDCEELANFGFVIKDPLDLPERSFERQLSEILNQYQSKKVDKSDFYYNSKDFAYGATAHVHKGVQISTNSIVAIKILNCQFNCLKELIYLRREIGFLTRLKSVSSESNKYIANFIGFCNSDDRKVWLIFEYKKNNLFDIEGNLTNDQKTKIAFEIAQAVQYLHSQDIFHRDLKTGNIVVDDDYTPLLIDFGYSQSDIKSFLLTEEIGTSNYMAPEVIIGNGQYTRSVDIFSYGMILWELYDGNYPFYNVKETRVLFAKYTINKFGESFEEGIKEILKDNNEEIIQDISAINKDLFESISNTYISIVRPQNLKYTKKKINEFHDFLTDTYSEQINILKNQDSQISNKLSEYISDENKKLIVVMMDLLNCYTCEVPTFVKKIICEGFRPPFTKEISNDMKNLIEEAWCDDASKRPPINKIIEEMLEKNISFLPDEKMDEDAKRAIEEFYDKKRGKIK